MFSKSSQKTAPFSQLDAIADELLELLLAIELLLELELLLATELLLDSELLELEITTALELLLELDTATELELLLSTEDAVELALLIADEETSELELDDISELALAASELELFDTGLLVLPPQADKMIEKQSKGIGFFMTTSNSGLKLKVMDKDMAGIIRKRRASRPNLPAYL